MHIALPQTLLHPVGLIGIRVAFHFLLPPRIRPSPLENEEIAAIAYAIHPAKRSLAT